MSVTRWSTFARALRKIPGVTELPSQFSKRPALWINGREIAHAHPEGDIDLRLTRAGIKASGALPVGVHLRGRDWVEIENTADITAAIELGRIAAEAHAAMSEKPVPSPPQIARRQRLHRG